MPFVYDLSLATAGNLTTSGTPATETDAIFVKGGSAGRLVLITEFNVIGKVAAGTTLTGIAFRGVGFATASTSGTGITPRPRDITAQAAKATAASRPTAGSTRINRWVVGSGAGGPVGWWAKDDDHAIKLESGYAGSFDIFDVSGVASMVYEMSLVLEE